MRRGTTPTLTITINGVTVSDLATIYVTFKQGDVELTKTNDDISIDEYYNTISVPLTQEDTLMFNGNVSVQIRALLSDGVTAIASKIKTVSIDRILLDGVIKPKEEEPTDDEEIPSG